MFLRKHIQADIAHLLALAELMAQRYQTEVADLGRSAQEIARLWIENLRGYSSAQSANHRLRTGYLTNPAGEGVALLLYADDDRMPKGVQCLHPRTFHLGAQRFHGACIADFAVSREHRSLGPALMLLRRIAEVGVERFDLVYGLPNAKSTAVCKRAGLKCIGYIRRYVKVLRLRDQLARRIPTWMATSIALSSDPLLRCRDLLRSFSAGPRLTCRPTTWSDAKLDLLWAQRPKDMLLSDRSSRSLTWRFNSIDSTMWQVCLIEDQAGAPHGYVVWSRHGQVAKVGDFFAPAMQQSVTAMMLAFARLARAEGASSVSVEFFGDQAVVSALMRAGMLEREDQQPVFEVDASLLAGKAEAKPHSYLTCFDSDAD